MLACMPVFPVLIQGPEERATAVYKLRLQWKMFKSWQSYYVLMTTGVSALCMNMLTNQNTHVNLLILSTMFQYCSCTHKAV